MYVRNKNENNNRCDMHTFGTCTHTVKQKVPSLKTLRGVSWTMHVPYTCI